MEPVRPIHRLLIANRGEIAVRIARTARSMGIDTVGVYAEPDRRALHTDAVDVAVALGGSAPADSYLSIDRLLEAAAAGGCDAVHPGYGFLAENAGFAAAVLDNGMIWVGPTPEQIDLLGDKVAAKDAAAAAGVPTAEVIVVGDDGRVPGDLHYPVLVKAAAGGGGRGMRLVLDQPELGPAIESARREAEAAFGDGRVFVEPFLENARHIEVQVIGDRHGTVLHLGERECSIQRRHQKIVEEAPSAGIGAAARSAVLEGAVALARHVGYENAGTVEFLVGSDDSVSFLEVNTRLQVEHPVTEEVTGLDLVELQLRVAAGEPLPLGQEDVRLSGHAIEARVVAEDPAGGWLPSTGLVTAFSVAEGVRVDTGIRAGDVIGTEYDSLVAKVIAHGTNRSHAVRRLERALRTAAVAGVATNRGMLVATLREPDFLAARTSTSYLDDHPAVAAGAGPEGDDQVALLLAAVFTREAADRRGDGVTGFAPSGWRNVPTQGQRQRWSDGVDTHHVEFALDGEAARVWLGEWPEPVEAGSLADDERREVVVRLLDRSSEAVAIEVDAIRRRVSIDVDGDTVHAHSAAGSSSWTLLPTFVVHAPDEAGSGPISPLPGTVLAVPVTAGQRVDDGDVLMVIEAMKMEHTITAVGSATVVDARFAPGDRVEAGDLLVELHHDD